MSADNVRKIRSVEKTAASGSRRDLLVALRDLIWLALHDERTQPRDLSPLTLRLKELHAEIEAVDQLEGQESNRTASRDRAFDIREI